MQKHQLGYQIPSSILKKAGISSLRVYVSAVNPFIFYSPLLKMDWGLIPKEMVTEALYLLPPPEAA
jgi:hypothetical protein